MKRLLTAACLAVSLHAQVDIKFTPEPMSVPTAALATARDLGRWEIEACNNGTAPVSLAWERISMATSIRFIDTDDATLVLMSNQRRTTPARIVRAATVLSQAAAIALAIASKSNYSWAAGLSIGGAIGPQVIQMAEAQVPSVAPLLSGARYPVDLAPGACFTDHRFAAKMPKVAVVTAVIPTVKESLTVGPQPQPSMAGDLRFEVEPDRTAALLELR